MELGGVRFSLSLADRAASSSAAILLRFFMDFGRERKVARLVDDFDFFGFVGEASFDFVGETSFDFPSLLLDSLEARDLSVLPRLLVGDTRPFPAVEVFPRKLLRRISSGCRISPRYIGSMLAEVFKPGLAAGGAMLSAKDDGRSVPSELFRLWPMKERRTEDLVLWCVAGPLLGLPTGVVAMADRGMGEWGS
jgi:hypothetical protein